MAQPRPFYSDATRKPVDQWIKGIKSRAITQKNKIHVLLCDYSVKASNKNVFNVFTQTYEKYKAAEYKTEQMIMQ